MTFHFFTLVLMLGCVARADILTLRDSTEVQGRFQGYSNRRFQFKPDDGAPRLEYAIDVKSIVLGSPVRASLSLAMKSYDSVVLSRIDHHTLRFRKEGVLLTEPVILLKSLDVLGPVVRPPVPPADAGIDQDPAVTTRIVAPGRAAETRDWKGAGKWHVIETDKTPVISRGEVVDIENSLKRGVVNVVHFHYPQAVGSVREGNYLQGIMARRPNRLMVLKVVAQDFNAPICVSLNLKTLPQFWFYNAEGRLVKKLTDRFTEGDIDAALKAADR